MDFQTLGAAAAKSQFSRPVILGRVCQADADVFAYDCADLDASVSENWSELKKWIETVRLNAQSEFINLHLTMDMKGGRFEFATVKPYQENRSNRDPEKQARVWELRHKMAEYTTNNTRPVAWYHQEADDGMAQYQTRRVAQTNDVQSSIIYSDDKDLWMVQGLHCNTRSFEIYKVDGFGTCGYKEVGNVKPKLIGTGPCWFWHQMIMGDKADHIPGLPYLTGRLAEIYLPLKKPNPKRKDLLCGEAKAVAIMKGVTDHKTACYRVCEAYHSYYGPEWRERFIEQGFLLWMRREDDELDLLKYLEKECGSLFQLTKQQKESLLRFMLLRQAQSAREPTNGF